MTTSDKLREIAVKWELTQADLEIWKAEGRIVQTPIPEFLTDLTALISEKQAEYFEFVKWIGFYSTTLYYRDIDEKWLRTRFDIDGIPTEEYDEYTTEELFEYWKTNEK